MSSELIAGRYSFEHTVLECIAELGIENVRLEHLGARLGRSRTTMYRVYRCSRRLFELIHEAVLERVNLELTMAIVRALAIWTLLMSSGDFPVNAPEAALLRELAWAVLGMSESSVSRPQSSVGV